MVEEKEKSSILYIEDGKKRNMCYCESWRQYWDEVTNKKLDGALLGAAWPGEIKGPYQDSSYENVKIGECWEKS